MLTTKPQPKGCTASCLGGLTYFLLARVTLFVLWLTGYSHGVFAGRGWAVAGFIFMPFTTLAYELALLCNNHQFSPWWVVAVVVGVLLDVRFCWRVKTRWS